MEVADYEFISRSDFPDMPEGMDRLVDSMNRTNDLQSRAMQNNLTWLHNFHAEEINVSLTHDVSTQIRLQSLRSKPRGMMLVHTDLFDYAKVAWQVVDQVTVNVKVKFDTAPTDVVECRFVFWGS